MQITKIYDNGQTYAAEVLDISDDDILGSMQKAITNVAAFGLATGYVTAPAAAHMMANAFQNLVYATHELEDPFPLAT